MESSAPTADAAPEPTRDLWPDAVAPVRIEDLVGTPEWLDELATLPVHQRVALGLSFKVHEVTHGSPVFRCDFGSEVPTAAVLAARFPRGGAFVVRASKRRASKGGGNLTEVRITVAPQDGAASGSTDPLVARVVEAALERMPGGAPKVDRRSDDAPPAWLLAILGRARDAVAPWLPKVAAMVERFGGDEAGATDAAGVVKVVKDSGLLEAVAKWIGGQDASKQS